MVAARWRYGARDPPLCALILVDCLVTEDAPNGLIGMGKQLAGLKLRCQTRDCGPNGVCGPVARRDGLAGELPSRPRRW